MFVSHPFVKRVAGLLSIEFIIVASMALLTSAWASQGSHEVGQLERKSLAPRALGEFLWLNEDLNLDLPNHNPKT